MLKYPAIVGLFLERMRRINSVPVLVISPKALIKLIGMPSLLPIFPTISSFKNSTLNKILSGTIAAKLMCSIKPIKKMTLWIKPNGLNITNTNHKKLPTLLMKKQSQKLNKFDNYFNRTFEHKSKNMISLYQILFSNFWFYKII